MRLGDNQLNKRIFQVVAIPNQTQARRFGKRVHISSFVTARPVYYRFVSRSTRIVNASFRLESRRVLNRGGAVNVLKRAIYTGRARSAQAKRADEKQAVAYA